MTFSGWAGTAAMHGPDAHRDTAIAAIKWLTAEPVAPCSDCAGQPAEPRCACACHA